MKDLEKRLIAIGWFDNLFLHGTDIFFNKKHPKYKPIFITYPKIDALQYHKSYDWTMPVVEKIVSITGYHFMLTKNKAMLTIKDERNKEIGLYFGNGSNAKECIFELVSNYCLEWCNENNIKID